MSAAALFAGVLVLIAGGIFFIYLYVSRYKDGYINGWLDCMEALDEEFEELEQERFAMEAWTSINAGAQALEDRKRKTEEYLAKRSGFLEEDM